MLRRQKHALSQSTTPFACPFAEYDPLRVHPNQEEGEPKEHVYCFSGGSGRTAKRRGGLCVFLEQRRHKEKQRGEGG